MKRSLGLFSLLFGVNVLGQINQYPDTSDIPSKSIRPTFLHYQSDTIYNASYLWPFFQSLNRLIKMEEQHISIVHIGDSHIQADGFSGIVRTELQKKYGTAGRGLIFPYRLAKSNHPRDYYSQTNSEWQAKRNIAYFSDFPTGIAGYAATTSDPKFALKIGVKTFNGIENSFDQISIIHGNGPQYFDLLLLDNEEDRPLESWKEVKTPLTHRVGKKETVVSIAKQYHLTTNWIKKTNHLTSNNLRPGSEIIVGYNIRKQVTAENNSNSFEPLGYIQSNNGNEVPWATSTISLEGPKNEITIGGYRSKSEQNAARIYGIILENSEASGIIYHTAGVNGAQLNHFLRSDYFTDQLSIISPQLVIISFGTNEAFDNHLDTLVWARNMDSLVYHLRKNNPGVSILFTTPPDSWRGGYPRPLLDPIIRTMYRKSDELHCALWDFREVMGGKGSMKIWNDANLSQDDLVHLTTTGYNLQGFLLIEALEKAQNEFIAH